MKNFIRISVLAMLSFYFSAAHAVENPLDTMTQLLANEILGQHSAGQALVKMPLGVKNLQSGQETTVSAICRFVDAEGNLNNTVQAAVEGHWASYSWPHPFTSVFIASEPYQTVLNRCMSNNPTQGQRLTDLVTVPVNNFSHDIYFSDLGRQNMLPFNRIIYFGDSLSDSSNDFRYYSVIMHAVGPGEYWNKRFSNGLIWSDWLSSNFAAANGKGLALPSENFAYGGAYSVGIRNGIFPDLATQVTSYLAIMNNNTLAADEGSTLFSVLVGGNDFLSTDNTPAIVADAVNQQLERLSEATLQQGATHIYFLLPRLPDVSQAPSQQNVDEKKRLQEQLYIQEYNFLMDQNVQKLENNPGFPAGFVVIFRPDLDTYLNQVTVNAAQYHLSATTTCMVGKAFGKSTVCAAPADSVYWDGLHPGSTVGCIFGQKVTADIEAQLHLPLSYYHTDINADFVNLCRYTYVNS